MTRQLSFFELLDRPKVSAEIHCLPTWTRNLVRQAASDILMRPVEKQDWHRRDQVSIFRNRMAARGLPAAAIEHEATAFIVALECEMRRQVIWSIIWNERGDAA
ncbi:DUF6074 family protein [Mesorhizobium sp. M0496]|uniref:DUF6074 family protein n=1 Tax=Mesorhizobium sp. M0496 TaxID=2956952 RepID=UPI003337F3BE